MSANKIWYVAFRTLVWAIAAIAIGAFGSMLVPDKASEVTGVAVEASRDVNRQPTAVVEYTYNGQTRTELVPAEVVAGETVTFGITQDGAPSNGHTWLGFFVGGGLFAAAAIGLASCVNIMLAMSYESKLYTRQRAHGERSYEYF